MNIDVIKFKVNELVKFRDGIANREIDLKASLNNLRIAKKNINSILAEFPPDNKNGVIFLPKDIFETIRINSVNITTSFNWKKVSLEIIQNADDFLPTSELYSKAKIKYPIELANKEKAIRSFSAALQYLLAEKKIIRIIKDKKHLYGKK